MDTMLVAVFETETAAFDGLGALRDLHNEGDITLFAWAVIVKDTTGKISVRRGPEQEHLGAALGLLAGKLLDLLKGPAGLAIAASFPGLTGYLFDLDMSRLGPTALDDVAKALTPGKAAVLAEVEESSTTRVDDKLREHGGIVFRRLPTEFIEDHLVRQSTEFEAKLKSLDEERKRAIAEKRAAIERDIEDVRKQLKATQDHAKARLDQVKAETAAKLKALEDQAKRASDHAKAQIEKRVADLKANFELRSQKLTQASSSELG